MKPTLTLEFLCRRFVYVILPRGASRATNAPTFSWRCLEPPHDRAAGEPDKRFLTIERAPIRRLADGLMSKNGYYLLAFVVLAA